jgi:type IV secretion system protein VirD4
MGTFALKMHQFFLFLSAAYHRIYALISPDKRLHQARFSRVDELHTLLHPTPPPDSLLLGTTKAGFVAVRLTKERREIGNLLVVAPTRGGKGLLAVSQLLSWQHSVVVNDIKGELFQQTAGYRSTLGKVYVIDPTGVGHRFDPLHGKQTEDEFYSSASHLLFEAEERERIFTQRATTMLTQLFLAARIEGISPFPYVRSLILMGLANTAGRLNAIDPQLATQFLDTNFDQASLTDKFLLSSWGTLTARLRPLLTETVVRSLTRSDFTPEELLCSDKPVSVYIRWKEQDLLALSPLVRLLWGTLINELTTTYDNREGADCNPVLLLVDEAGRTAIPMLADQATTVVGRGISLWIAVQSLSQLETVYGRARAQVLRDNMDTQLYYRPADLTTAKYLEERLGLRSAYAHSETLRDGLETSTGETERGIPLFASQDIAHLTDRQLIGFHRQLYPFKLNRCDHRNHLLFQKRRSMPAPTLDKLPPLADLPKRSPEQFSHETLIDPDHIPDGIQQKDDLAN